MKEQVRIVTDSTADIPDDLAEELGVSIIYDYINFGTESLQDKIDITRPEFYRRLVTQANLPTTASPGVGEFLAVYRRVIAPGVHILSLHPPAHLSALYNTAHLAARDLAAEGGQVTVLDTRQFSMGMGWQVIAAARAALAGAGSSEIIDLVTAMQPRIRVFAVLNSMEFLHRSGRVSWARAALGTLLNIKPILSVRDGEVIALDRVRTARRATERLIELTEQLGFLESLAVLHTNIPSQAGEFRQRLSHLRPIDAILTVDVTPVIGTHVGPNAVGVAAVATQSIP